MKTLLYILLLLLVIACKPLDMTSVEGVNFYPYAEDSIYKQGELFPLLPEDAEKGSYQYLNFKVMFEGRYLHLSYDKLNNSEVVTETKTFKGRWRKRGWKYVLNHNILPFFPILSGETLHKIYLKPKGQQDLEVHQYYRDWAFSLLFGWGGDSGNYRLYFKAKELLPQPVVYFEQGHLGLMKGSAVLIPAQYNEITLFKEGVSQVRKDSLWGLINTEGKELTSIIYNNISYEDHYKEPPFFLVEKDNLWGTIDLKGKEIIPIEYQHLQYEWISLSLRLLLAQKEGLWGFINMKGEEVLPFAYDYIYKGNYGYALVKGDKVGFWSYSKEERRFISAVYTKIDESTLYNDYTLVYDGFNPLFIDREGNEYDPQIDEVRGTDAFFGYSQRDSKVKIGDKYYYPNIESKRAPRKEIF
ncbi:hypothetical protein RCZ04_11570 [Capnocytophaga sp. HP1101]